MLARASAKWSSVLYVYFISLIGGLACLWAIMRYGQVQLSGAEASAVIGQTEPLLQAMAEQLRKNVGSPLGSLMLQILTILVASRLCGMGFRRLGQPRVIGEILSRDPSRPVAA